MRIVVAGTGYVGLSSALLLSQNNEVIVTDILQDRITKLNQGLSPIDDIEIADFLKKTFPLSKSINIIKIQPKAQSLATV